MKQQPLFLTSVTAKEENPLDLIFAKTGFKELDERIVGLARQNLSIISGHPGSGKSSWLSQLCLNMIDQNINVAMFSGELSASMVFAWLRLQAAGKDNVSSPKRNGYYEVSKSAKDLINKWTCNRLYVYNNEYGDDYEHVMTAMKDCLHVKGCKLIIIDNLMTLDINKLPGKDKYEKQTAFAIMMKKFARDNDIHVAVVAHPKKTSGLLRVWDISGSGDIRGVADNIFLIHRMDIDTIRQMQEEKIFKKDNTIFGCDNAIEISKSRFSGHVMGGFVEMFFDVPTKRFRTDKYQDEHIYGWNYGKNLSIPKHEAEYIVLEDDSTEMPFDL